MDHKEVTYSTGCCGTEYAEVPVKSGTLQIFKKGDSFKIKLWGDDNTIIDEIDNGDERDLNRFREM